MYAAESRCPKPTWVGCHYDHITLLRSMPINEFHPNFGHLLFSSYNRRYGCRKSSCGSFKDYVSSSTYYITQGPLFAQTILHASLSIIGYWIGPEWSTKAVQKGQTLLFFFSPLKEIFWKAERFSGMSCFSGLPIQDVAWAARLLLLTHGSWRSGEEKLPV